MRLQLKQHPLGLCRRFRHPELRGIPGLSTLAALYHEGLAGCGVPRLRRVTDQQFAFRPRVEVVELADAKGLEFDYVVLLETSELCYPDDPPSRRLLHVGVTRAVHQLWLTCVGRPSPLIDSAAG